jgi:outer membrane protein assembly factor BamB
MKYHLVLSLLLIVFTSSIHAQSNGWNNGGGNAYRNGFVNTIGPTTDSVLWQANASGIFGTPLFIEGNYLVTMRFISMTNAPVECYDLNSGNLLWSVDVTNQSGRSLPVGLRDERVYVVRYTESLNDSLYALNVFDGSYMWTSNATVSNYITETGVFDSSGYFYILGNNFDKTVKINPSNGQMIWQTNTVPMASGSGEMAIHNSSTKGYTLEQLGGLSYLWAIDLLTGQKLYSLHIPQLVPGGNVCQSALMVGFDGTIYVHLTEDNIASVTDNGSGFNINWQTVILGNSSFSLMCVGADGSIYAPTDGRIIRLNPVNGAVVNLSAPITQGGFFSPRLTATSNNVIYATNGENYVYAFNQNLNLLWSDYIPNTNTSGVCVSPNGLAAVCGQGFIRVYTPTQTSNLLENTLPNISYYPNPAKSFLNISVDGWSEDINYSLIDISGRQVSSGTISNSPYQIDLTMLSKGLYFLELNGSEKSMKIIKE